TQQSSSVKRLLNAVIENVVHLFSERHGDEGVRLLLRHRGGGYQDLFRRWYRFDLDFAVLRSVFREFSLGQIRRSEEIAAIALPLSKIGMFQIFVERDAKALHPALAPLHNADPLKRRRHIARFYRRDESLELGKTCLGLVQPVPNAMKRHC